MNIQGNDYTINFDGGQTLAMSGKLAAMPEEYEEIEIFFENALAKMKHAMEAGQGASELIVDIRELTFLNSSGIKTICVSLVMEADDIQGLGLKLLCNHGLTWQVETIPTFKDLMDNLEIVFQ